MTDWMVMLWLHRRGHYQRALEEVIQTHSSQWPRAWQGKNPLHGGRTFTSMSPEERVSQLNPFFSPNKRTPFNIHLPFFVQLTLLKSLILWSLSSSDAIQSKIKESYKQSRRDDDINQPLSVQPWGTDARKRRYWLIEGQDDTHFRLYRETYPNSPKRTTWWSVAGTIDELRAVADRLVEDRNLNSRRLSEKIYASIPRFEASEEKRKRRDYRLARKAAFARPEPGFSLYEGRTRGKKMKYTYSDEEDDVVSGGDFGTRRSARNRQSSPVEQGPVYTASGRQVKARQGGMYGEILSSSRGNRGSSVAGAGTGDENGYNSTSNGRVTRSNFEIQVVNGYKSDEWNSDEKNGDVIRSDGGWENGDDADSSSEGNTGGASDQPSDVQDSLIVRLQYRKTRSQNLVNGNGTETEAIDSDIQNPMPSSPPQLNGTSFSIADIPAATDTAPTSIPLEQPFEGQQPNGVSLPDATNFHAPAPAPVEKTEQSVSPVGDAPAQEKTIGGEPMNSTQQDTAPVINGNASLEKEDVKEKENESTVF